MHPIVKIIIGAMMMVASVAAIVGLPQFGLLEAFLTVLKGVIPPFVFLIGLFIVWLELDELRIERELKAEEEKEKKARRKKRK